MGENKKLKEIDDKGWLMDDEDSYDLNSDGDDDG